MANPPDNLSMALFCDFENVALGVRDANYEKFDIKPVLERLLLKGSIVVKKAYCDWERYKGFKAAMHEANFELIEIPHVRQSGKNSADIRLVVDALDLCYTKSHVNTFVIISGDSDFSPLVSKLRENNKQVIGVGVKQSTSDLLIANCDEFIFYDDLVREKQRALARRQAPAEAPQAARRSPEEERRRKEASEEKRNQAIELAVETFDALMAERGDSGKIWASVLKEAIKRRRPDFNESYFGFRTFGNLLEEAHARGLMEFGRDEKSGAYVFRSSHGAAVAPVLPATQSAPAAVARTEAAYERPVSRYFPPEAFAPAPAPSAEPEAPAPASAGEATSEPAPEAERPGKPRGQEERREDRRDQRRDERHDGRRERRRDGDPHAQALPERDEAVLAAAAEAEARAKARQQREQREREALQRPTPAAEPAAPDAPAAPADLNDAVAVVAEDSAVPAPAAPEAAADSPAPRRRSRGGRGGKGRAASAAPANAEPGQDAGADTGTDAVADASANADAGATAPASRPDALEAQPPETAETPETPETPKTTAKPRRPRTAAKKKAG